MNFIDAFNNALFEDKDEKKEKQNKNKKYIKGLKLFYAIDVKIAQPEQIQQQQQNQSALQTPPPVPATPPAPVSTATQEIPANIPTESFVDRVNLILEEENIDEKIEGILTVSEGEVDNIQTLEDLLDYLSDKKADNGQRIVDDFVIETIYAATGINGTELGDILQKNDKLLIDLDYGSSKKDSVGIKVLKRSGVNNISIMLKKNGNIIPAKFNLSDFNNQLIVFRNSIFGENK